MTLKTINLLTVHLFGINLFIFNDQKPNSIMEVRFNDNILLI